MTVNAFPEIPRINVGDYFATAVDWVTVNLAGFFELIKLVIGTAVDTIAQFLATPSVVGLALVFGILGLALGGWKWGLGSLVAAGVVGQVAVLTAMPPSVLLVLAFGVVGFAFRGWKFGLLALAAFALVDAMGLWEQAMSTLALVLVASVVAILIAVPLGVAAGTNGTVRRILEPVLDFMQTMPAFVYLIPVVLIFSVGVVPGVLATVVFAMPPGVRLAELGIRQVDREVVEAGEAFGASRWEILRRIQLPLALPTIMAGINQVIMLALSMVVIAGMVGAGGLGSVVYTALSSTDISTGFEGGLAVVLLAIYLDRLTKSMARRSAVVRAQELAAR